LVNEEKAKAVLLSKINLNTLVPSGIYGLNARTFEIAGIGGFQILHWRVGLSDLFKDGNELISFNNFNELLEKLEYFLPKDELRKEIAIAGQKRAYKDHTYAHRLKLLLDTVFRNGKGFENPQLNNSINR
jgi:spore maturation protein CgeB